MPKYTVHASVLVSFEYEFDTADHDSFDTDALDEGADPENKDEVYNVVKTDLEYADVLMDRMQDGCSVDKVEVTIKPKQ
jgi:hypothetical protein